MSSRPRLLLHVCCGPCATVPVERLQDSFDVTLFFSNSNIWPAEEYERRLHAARQLAAWACLPLIEAGYDHAAWRARIQGLENEPERGARCRVCWEFNLGRAAAYAQANGFDRFTTTLLLSPHKPAQRIAEVGKALGPFWETDFSSCGGFLRSVALSRQYRLYRQKYCGCEFSRRDNNGPSGAVKSSGGLPLSTPSQRPEGSAR